MLDTCNTFFSSVFGHISLKRGVVKVEVLEQKLNPNSNNSISLPKIMA